MDLDGSIFGGLTSTPLVRSNSGPSSQAAFPYYPPIKPVPYCQTGHDTFDNSLCGKLEGLQTSPSHLTFGNNLKRSVSASSSSVQKQSGKRTRKFLFDSVISQQTNNSGVDEVTHSNCHYSTDSGIGSSVTASSSQVPVNTEHQSKNEAILNSLPPFFKRQYNLMLNYVEKLKNCHLIGTRIGLDRIDFFHELLQADTSGQVLHDFLTIANFSSSDLESIQSVSQLWRSVILNSGFNFSPSGQILTCNAEKENMFTTTNSSNISDFSRNTLSSKRVPLSETQSLARTQSLPQTEISLQTASSVNSVIDQTKSKFDAYVEEGRKLVNQQKLTHCPRCDWPARVSSDIQMGECTTTVCGYVFCPICLCDQHPTKECPAQIKRSPTRPPSSEKLSRVRLSTKKRLKRL